MTKRRFFLEGKPDMHLDHFVVLAEGKLADLAPKAPVEEDAELQVELVEVDRHDGTAAVGKLDGFDVCVAGAASLVGKRVKVRIERVLDGVAYATLVRRAGKKVPEPLTAEAEAEKPTRKPPARKTPGAAPEEGGEVEEADTEEEAAEEPLVAEAEPSSVEEPEEPEEAEEAAEAAPDSAPAKRKTRRGSRGGKKRKKPAGAAEAEVAGAPADEHEVEDEAEAAPPEQATEAKRPVRIHLPSDELGRDGEGDEAPEGEQPSENGAAAARKRTRRGSRGGKNRRKRTAAAGAAAVGGNGAEPAPADETEEEPVEAVAAPEEPVEAEANADSDEDWGYVPMSEWCDEFQK